MVHWCDKQAADGGDAAKNAEEDAFLAGADQFKTIFEEAPVGMAIVGPDHAGLHRSGTEASDISGDHASRRCG